MKKLKLTTEIELLYIAWEYCLDKAIMYGNMVRASEYQNNIVNKRFEKWHDKADEIHNEIRRIEIKK